ncbi:hypothetical protein [Micromonospora sp. RTGN7]|uniref:hypothetical protein n=1 Tax=Micromonospora sp. RTGN7 TaxID=3016526 RepID=UPI0029FF4E63|nr:hypothetical protein [Micromonospora sp. RTGN7]
MGSVRVPRGWAARLTAAGLVATTAVAGIAAPAAAEDDPGWVSAWLGDTTIGAAGAPGRTAELSLSSTGATDPRVSFDLTGLAGVATAAFPSWCTTSASTVTCPMPATATTDEWGTVNGTVPVVLRATAGAADGASGTLSYTVAADQIEPTTQQATVTVAAGPAMVDLIDAYVPGPAVGDTVHVPVAVTNGGNQPVEDLRLTLRFSVGLSPAAYKNCRYGTDPLLLTTVMVCTVRGSFAPGQRYELRGGIATTVTPAALGDKRALQFVEPLATAGPLPAGVKLTRREADRRLRLRAAGEPVDVLESGQDNAWGQYYLRNIRGAFDVVALGATAAGAIGDTVRVQVGIRNDGPGVPDDSASGGGAASFRFVPPAGTTVTGHSACWPSGEEEDTPIYWYCGKPGLIFRAGETFTVTFDLRIDGPIGAAGEVQVNNPYPRTDDTPANDVAAVTLS